MTFLSDQSLRYFIECILYNLNIKNKNKNDNPNDNSNIYHLCISANLDANINDKIAINFIKMFNLG